MQLIDYYYRIWDSILQPSALKSEFLLLNCCGPYIKAESENKKSEKIFFPILVHVKIRIRNLSPANIRPYTQN